MQSDMKVVPLFATVFLLLASACAHDASEVSVTPADLGAYEGRDLFVEGTPVARRSCTAVFCEADGPCNNCRMDFIYELPSGEELTLVPETGFTAEGGPATGFSPLPCYYGMCDPIELGCVGNDWDAQCAPAVPTRIVGVQGRLVGNSIVVSRVDVSGGPTEIARSATTPRYFE